MYRASIWPDVNLEAGMATCGWILGLQLRPHSGPLVQNDWTKNRQANSDLPIANC